MQSMIQQTTTISLRRAKSAFKFAKNRDDHNPGLKTAWVLTTRSPLIDGMGDVGVYGAPVVVLHGYRNTPESTTELRSVVAAEGIGSFIMGRAVEVSMDELAAIDQVAERAGNYHRFLAEATGPSTGMKFLVWVYQLLGDAGPTEHAASALNPNRIAA